MTKYAIAAAEELCSGCLRCQLVCSDAYTKSFNPSAARIRIHWSGSGGRIDFTEECNECGLCADNCYFGALSKVEKEGDA